MSVLSGTNGGYLQGVTPRNDFSTVSISPGLNLENHVPIPRNTRLQTADFPTIHPAMGSNTPRGFISLFSFPHTKPLMGIQVSTFKSVKSKCEV